MSYDPNIRMAAAGEDDCLLERIEVDFAIPVWITSDQQYALHELVQGICERPANVPVNGVHWQSGCGSKPMWSQADQRFLGKAVDPAAPASGEPAFDDSVFHMETSAREAHPQELERLAKLKSDREEEFPARGARLIAEERQRQIEKLGWTAAHDDKHNGMELSVAAACYVIDLGAPIPSTAHSMAQQLWPWAHYSFKRTPDDPIRQLVKAGALIAAEIDRLERTQLGGPKMAGESEVEK